MKKALLGGLLVVLLAFAALVCVDGFRANVHVFAQDATKASGYTRTVKASDPTFPERIEFNSLPTYSDAQPLNLPVRTTGIENRRFSAEQSELQKLRGEYSKIAQDKAALMNVEELRKAVEDSRSDFAELQAAKQLEAAVGNLNKIIEQYPNSKAAKSARKLLGQPDETNDQDVREAPDDSTPATTPSDKPIGQSS